MATAQFYMIYIDRNKDATYTQVEEKMNLAIDWYRIKDGLWLVYTTSDEEKWYSRLKPFVNPKGYVFICKLDVYYRQGWMQKAFWKWIRREKDDS